MRQEQDVVEDKIQTSANEPQTGHVTYKRSIFPIVIPHGDQARKGCSRPGNRKPSWKIAHHFYKDDLKIYAFSESKLKRH